MSDLISRQAAIDALEREKSLVERPITETRWFDFGLRKAQDVLSELPSAQAEPCGDVPDNNVGECEDALGRAENAIGNLPSAQPEKRTEERAETHACDLIDREAAVDAIYHHLPSVSRTRARTMLHEVPSAQPDIIRCGDCKWYGRADKRRFYRGMDCLQKRIDTIVPDRDFCSKAERRTDD